MESSATPDALRVAIIGGGIGGLSLLIGLLNHTDRKVIDPHLYEAASAFSEIGAGVAFGPNAVRSMNAVDPSLYEAYLKIAAKAPILDVNGEKKVAWHHFLMGMDGKSAKCNLKAMEEICTAYNDNRTHNVHRAAFLESMLSLLSLDQQRQLVTFKKRLTSIDQVDNGKLKLIFGDGTIQYADAIIGCDGVKSKVRQILLSPIQSQSEIEPQFTGKYAYRGLIPMEEAVKAIGEQARVNLMFWGYGGHLVTFPIDQGKTLNVVAFQSERSERWPHGEQWVVPATVEDVINEYQDWSHEVKKLLQMIEKPEKWGLFDHPPAKTFYRGGSFCILGDCAHASTPHQGAGAGMAIEDAAVLVNLLGQVKFPSTSNLETAFSVYDQVRRTRDQKLVITSREAGLLYDLEQPGIEDDVEKIREVCAYRYKWLWEHDTNSHIQEAIKILQDKLDR